MIRILFLNADPTDTPRLRLQEELRDIRERLRQANLRETFQLEYALSVRPGDISQAILDFKPHIVHFSGHGTRTGELCLEDESGRTQPVNPEALAKLFKLVAHQVNCVVLNACYSDIQAKTIVRHIPFVIGMKQAIGDQAAIAFAVGFYKALGGNRSIENAFNFGCNEIQLRSIAEELTPVLYRKDIGIYIERPAIEKRCYEEIIQPGSLIRITAPDKMGKTSLMNRIVTYARAHNYQTVTLSLHELVNETVATDLVQFLKSFCIAVGNELHLPNMLNEYWDNQATPMFNSKIYFQKHLLANTASPLVLALNNVDLVFEQPALGSDFCKLIRNCYDRARLGNPDSNIWEKLRLIIVHSTEFYLSLDINVSPLANVGLVVELPEFSLEQVQCLVERRGLNWTTDQVKQLMHMVGGHPFLLQKACDYFILHEITFEYLLEVAPTLEGPFRDHLVELMEKLKNNPELKKAFMKVVKADNPVQIEPNFARLLQRLGLVKLYGNFSAPRCELYRKFFRFFG